MKSTQIIEEDKFFACSPTINYKDLLKFTFVCSLSYLESVKSAIISDKSITDIAYDISSSFFVTNEDGEIFWNEHYSKIFKHLSNGSELEFEILNKIIKRINEEFNLPSKVPVGK